jgi:ribose transport system ATP-binding protein
MDDFSLDDIVYYMTGQRPDKSKKDVVHSHSDGGREIVLDVKNLSIFPKVHDISLRAHKGEIVGIGGLQGQGQPELIRAILGAIRYEEGEIIYDGEPSTFKLPSKAVKKRDGLYLG